MPDAAYLSSRDYIERVYAGVLGKIIGVYLGRPFEGWSNEHIERELGEVDQYVHERLKASLIVTDDDISGTFTFVRALSENSHDPNLTAAQIGDWWRNVIVEKRAILWWGGMGRSTEHTAFLRLKSGMAAPESGSIATNGKVVAEQIGAQIFIDGWAALFPGDPERAADWARRAASVSHDGEAIYGAQIIAAMEALAFVDADRDRLLDVAVTFIPPDCTIRRLIEGVRGWAATNGQDWRATLRSIQRTYGYDHFGGGCHIVPNHAVIIMALLHGNDDFTRSLMIANTAGYDTDCNSGNIGCLLGIKNGLAAIDAAPVDWRGPVADRLYLPTADGGRAITDAVREVYALVNTARGLAGLDRLHPKNGARFHFSLPGSVQGFRVVDVDDDVSATLANEKGALAITVSGAGGVVVVTPTFTPPADLRSQQYPLLASPTLYPGQTVVARIRAGADNSAPSTVSLLMRLYGSDDALVEVRGPSIVVFRGEVATLTWPIPTEGYRRPIAEVGLRVDGDVHSHILLDSLDWTGTPDITLGPSDGGDAWQKAWVSSADSFTRGRRGGLEMALRQDEGEGLVTQGEWEWENYAVGTTANVHLCRRAGLAACVRGLRRYVAIMLDAGGRVRLIRQFDESRTVLAEARATWDLYTDYQLSIAVTPTGISARFGDEELVALGADLPKRGAIGLVVEAGFVHFAPVTLRPAV